MRRFEAVASRLMAIPVTDARAERVLRDVFQMRESTEGDQEGARYAKHHATKAMEVYASAPDLRHIAGTGWGVLNAVAQYVDHESVYGKGSQRAASGIRMQSILWGNAAGRLNRTVALLGAAALMDAGVVKAAARMSSRIEVGVS